MLIGALCLGVQAWALAGHGGPGAREHWQTMVFTLLALAQMAHLLAIRSEHESLFTQGLRSNLPLLGAVVLTLVLQLATGYVPWLQPIFHTQTLSAGELGLCVALAAVVFVAVEIDKIRRRQAARLPTPPAG